MIVDKISEETEKWKDNDIKMKYLPEENIRGKTAHYSKSKTRKFI
jgi:hypothetical protein